MQLGDKDCCEKRVGERNSNYAANYSRRFFGIQGVSKQKIFWITAKREGGICKLFDYLAFQL